MSSTCFVNDAGMETRRENCERGGCMMLMMMMNVEVEFAETVVCDEADADDVYAMVIHFASS